VRSGFPRPAFAGLVVLATVAATYPAQATPARAAHPSKPPKVVHQSVELTPSDAVANDDFGVSVAISGNTIVVGSFNHDDGNGAGEGAAYVYVKPKHGWALTKPVAELTPDDGASGDLFGAALDISGNTIVVGSPGHGGVGSIYVFTKPKTGWPATMHETAELNAPGLSMYDGLGQSAAIAGDTVVAGAPNHEVAGKSIAGVAYVWVRPKAGWASTSTPTATLTPSSVAAKARFGTAVAISGPTIAIGASDFAVGAKTLVGRGYVFARPAHGWSGAVHQRATLRPSDGTTNTAFGISIASTPSTIVVGSGEEDPYVFARPKAGWSGSHQETARLTYPKSSKGAFFGTSVAISGSTVVTGAPLQDRGGMEAGTAYAYQRAGSTWRSNSHPDLVLAEKQIQSGSDFGQVVAVAPGVVVVGTHGKDVGSAASQGVIDIFARPTMFAVAQSHKAWRAGPSLPKLDPKHFPASRGTVFRFGLDQHARIHFGFDRKTDGHDHHVATLVRSAPAGSDTLYFAGRLSHSRRLAAGHYQVAIWATNALGESKRHNLHFTIR
jgi:hypothetical protein